MSAPVELVRRTVPNLEISLRETGKGRDKRHFGLAIYTPGEIIVNGKRKTIHEYVLDPHEGCLVYVEDSRVTTNTQIAVSAKLIPHGHEASNAALEDAVKQQIHTAEKSYLATDANYRNCFDFAVQLVKCLKAAGYVSGADYAKLEDYWRANHEKVRAKTAAHVKEDIRNRKG
ncbi:hypothetical protein CPB84DRAFT_1855080 [Gymnopilus junonius]|uniref:Uncharacterized protein n=1 Tax=Gymnopilus junonius TaxID=109634 RepID=A0A9P5TFX5_GYMJU|nr:hypothetical protein CPB84DRAFT_1855080 [Gymnopilus junonius]